MDRLKRLFGQFKLPTVVELGWSDYDALPLREVTPKVEGYTWEDYEAKMKQEHPYLFWINRTLPSYFRIHFLMNWREKYWQLKSFLTQDYKLDLRQPKTYFMGCDEYRYGWCPTNRKILYALFNLLTQFKEKASLDSYRPSQEEIEQYPDLKENALAMEEADKLYHWWHVERKAEYDELLNSSAPKEKWDEFAAKEQEMCHRLIDIMPYLEW